MQISSKIKHARNLLKFGPFNFSNMIISVLISRIIFSKYFYQISINSEHFSFHFGTNLGLALGKYLIKNNFWHQNRDKDFRNIKCTKFQYILSSFNFGTNLGWTGGKDSTKIIFNIKINIRIFEVLHVPNFNKFWAFLTLAPFWA